VEELLKLYPCLDQTNQAYKDYFVYNKIDFDKKVVSLLNVSGGGMNEETRFSDLLKTYADYKYDIQDGNFKIDLIKLHPNKGEANTRAIAIVIAEPHVLVGTVEKQCKISNLLLTIFAGPEDDDDGFSYVQRD